MLFSPLIDKTRHKKLLPDVSFIGKICVKLRWIIAPLFVVLLAGAFVLSNDCPFTYSVNSSRLENMDERQTAYFKINDTFGTSNMVAILVPTTVLAQQHYQTAVSRFRGFPVNIDVLSRFRSAAEQNRTVQNLRSGTVDLIINTPTKGRRHDTDGFKIRRSAVEHSVGCVTSVDTARALLTVRRQGRSEDLTPIDITTI